MGRYMSPDGEVLVLRFPVLHSLTSGPLPPVRIERRSGVTAEDGIVYLVYEPYPVYADESEGAHTEEGSP